MQKMEHVERVSSSSANFAPPPVKVKWNSSLWCHFSGTRLKEVKINSLLSLLQKSQTRSAVPPATVSPAPPADKKTRMAKTPADFSLDALVQVQQQSHAFCSVCLNTFQNCLELCQIVQIPATLSWSRSAWTFVVEQVRSHNDTVNSKQICSPVLSDSIENWKLFISCWHAVYGMCLMFARFLQFRFSRTDSLKRWTANESVRSHRMHQAKTR